MNLLVKYKYLRVIVAWVGIFGLFVPFGYFPWWFAIPLSIFSFVSVGVLLVKAHEIEKSKNCRPHA